MARRRARLLELERDTRGGPARAERQAERRNGDADALARRLLGLQSQAGNEAVSTMVVQRDAAQPADKGVGTTKKEGVGTLTMDGVGAPLDVVQLSLASDSLSVTVELGPGVEDVVRLEQGNAAFEHALLTMSAGFSVAMTSVRIASMQFSRPDDRGGAHRADDDTRELLKLKLVFDSVVKKTKARPHAATDEWRKA